MRKAGLKNYVINPKERDHSRNSGPDGRIILMWTLKR
jgi:hypothetical protein